MSFRTLLITLPFILLPLGGCSFNAVPMPGVQVGVSATPDSLGITLGADPVQSACSFAQVVSWSWAETQFCPK
jgi:hypothetical protein